MTIGQEMAYYYGAVGTSVVVMLAGFVDVGLIICVLTMLWFVMRRLLEKRN